ncbi:MAG: diaminopimelate epimerase [Bacteroidetes bacterium]|nr:diaminopimelate epimerase [Bacteroidota bacterium]
MKIPFYKFHGTANDFIMLDNRKNDIQLTNKQVKRLCDRHTGIGADGLILISLSPDTDFEMIYYNADGNTGSMCGNGGRCAIKFASMLGIKNSTYHFRAMDGLHEASIEENGWVFLKMNDVHHIKHVFPDAYVLNTGSPHYVKQVTDLRDYPVVKEGKEIRYSAEYADKGINVNFVEELENSLFVRTYERGVEDETMSCGTGITASALVFAHHEFGFNHIDVHTLGGNLAVEFYKKGPMDFENIWLCGPAECSFIGEFDSASF